MKQKNRFYFATVIAGLLCLGLLLASNASAADYYGCNADIAKFCSSVPSDRQSILDCLEAHESDLSALCKETETRMGGRRVEMRERVNEMMKFRQACAADVDKFCADAGNLQGGVGKCLNEHSNELSNPCRDSIKALDAEKY